MAIQNREAFFKAAPALRVVDLFIPEMNETIHVSELSGAQRDAFEKTMISVSPDGTKTKLTIDNVRARLIVMTVVNDEGKLLFAESDAERIGDLGASIVSEIYNVASGLSKISKEDVDELLKNSVSVPSDASGSS